MSNAPYNYSSLLYQVARDIKQKKREKEQHAKAEAARKATWAGNPVDYVSPEKRRRSSLMDNPKMRYILDTRRNRFHDRDCPVAETIKDQDFSMVAELVPEDWQRHDCRYCYQMSLIRKGIGDQGKYINAYLKIFQALKANTFCLETLFLQHDATLVNAFPAQCALCIQVGEDRWIIQQTDGKNRLWHNNYRVLPSGERVFLDQFHAETGQEEVVGSFRHFVYIMCGHDLSERR